MLDFLNGFESRMRLMAAMHAIVDRRGLVNRNVEDTFDENEIDNLLIMVMVYLMDCTLRYNRNSTLDGVARFLAEAVPLMGKTYPDYNQLASYFIMDVLQNKGERRTFRLYNSAKGKMDEYVFRLVDSRENEQHHVVYQLTDEAYNLLFRTKEIDADLDFSVERFKLKEFVKRRNYSQALEQSRELIARVREQKASISLFIDRCRENIARVTVSEYETVAKSTQNLLNEEFGELEAIKEDVLAAEKKVKQDIESGDNSQKAQQSQQEIASILYNLDLTLDEQKSLINRRYSLSGLYQELLQEGLRFRNTKRFSLEEEILKPMERQGMKHLSKFGQLTAPLFKPRQTRILNLLTYYARQQKLREEEEKSELDVEIAEDRRERKAHERNSRFLKIMESLFTYFLNLPQNAHVGDYISTLSKEQLNIFCEENSLLHVLLKLYSIGNVDYESWRANPPEHIITPNGEFDLAYYLSVLEPKYGRIRSFSVTKTDDEVFTVPVGVERPCNIQITNFHLEAVLYEP